MYVNVSFSENYKYTKYKIWNQIRQLDIFLSKMISNNENLKKYIFLKI